MVSEDRHAKVDQLWPTIGWRSLEAVEFGHRSVEADLESLDLAEPAVGAGLADAFSEVLDDLDEAWPLAGIHLEGGAANAGFSEQSVSDSKLSCLGVAMRGIRIQEASPHGQLQL
ncbi:hypothetical protein [Streptomyces marianii]|uniref:hypothetical protein n=1 Tax=Streptomyces marianii TaxID=1817406 RepID=UPI001485DDAE|nr:hypothetical protein [Streptomyces marianii]